MVALIKDPVSQKRERGLVLAGHEGFYLNLNQELCTGEQNVRREENHIYKDYR